MTVPRGKSKTKEATLQTQRRRRGRARVAAALVRQDRVHAVQQLLLKIGEDAVYHWLTHEITQADVDAAKASNLVLELKPWKVAAPTARSILEEAWRNWRRQDAHPDRADRKRSQDERRAELAFTMAAKSGDIGAMLKANDQLARMHGSYEPAPVLPPPADDIDAEEAMRSIEHAHSMYQLARRRGLLTDAQAAKVIDAAASEVKAAAKVEEKPATDAPPPAPGGPN